LINGERFDKIILSGGGMFRYGCFNSKKSFIYSLAEDLGHSTTAVSPVLSPIGIKGNPLIKFAGIAFEAGLGSIKDSLLITHKGVSGPAALDYSAEFNDGDNVILSFLPNITEENFCKDFNKLRNGKNPLKDYLSKLLPKRLSAFHIEEMGFEGGVMIADISKKQLKDLVKNLYSYNLGPGHKFSYEQCWTTAGGVQLSEINMGSLESKIVPGLYFAGEIIDINGLCGGYNISFAVICAKILSEGIIKKMT
jgi:predicted Rossmann fold flavoprotein